MLNAEEQQRTKQVFDKKNKHKVFDFQLIYNVFSNKG